MKHIFELYLFKCCLFTSNGEIWVGVSNVEREGNKVTLTFEEYIISENMSTDCYRIVDDEDHLVTQRYLEEEKEYMEGEILQITFEVTDDSQS